MVFYQATFYMDPITRVCVGASDLVHCPAGSECMSPEATYSVTVCVLRLCGNVLVNIA